MSVDPLALNPHIVLATEAKVGTPQEFAAMMKSEYQSFGQMVKRFNIKPE